MILKTSTIPLKFIQTHLLIIQLSESIRELIKIGDWKNSLIKVGYQMDWDKKVFYLQKNNMNQAENGEDGTGYGRWFKRNVHDIINCIIIQYYVICTWY